MTKGEFLTGWLVLTAQPWGKPYRGSTPEAAIQLELYYKHVHRANPTVWVAVCEDVAQGDKWPSLSDLKFILQANGGYVLQDQKQIRHRPEYVECPPEVREKLARIGVKA